MEKRILVLFNNQHQSDAEHMEEVFENELHAFGVALEQIRFKKEKYYAHQEIKVLFKNVEQGETIFNQKHTFEKVYMISSLKSMYEPLVQQMLSKDITYCDRLSLILIDLVMEFEVYQKTEKVVGYFYDKETDSVKHEKVKEYHIGQGLYFASEEDVYEARRRKEQGIPTDTVAPAASYSQIEIVSEEDEPFYVSVESDSETVLVKL